MVKEVEVKNNTEILEDGLQVANFEKTPDIVTGTLSANGTSLSLQVNRLLKAGAVRKVTLQFMLPNWNQQYVAEYPLGTFGPDPAVTENTIYNFSLQPVLSTIVIPPPEMLPDEDVIVRFFSYENNTPFNFGTCYPTYDPAVAYTIGSYVQWGDRLWQCIAPTVGNAPPNTAYWFAASVPTSGNMVINLPFLISYPGMMVAPASTDGWYSLRTVDVETYVNGTQYYVNDVVFYSTGFFICIADSIGNLPTNTSFWSPMSAEQEHNLYEFGYDQVNNLPTILNTDMIITRHVKQKYIYELLAKSNYKKYDNIIVVTQLEKIIAMREAAIVHLNAGNPITARYLLDALLIDEKSFLGNNGERNVIQTITNFTI